jgi:hypothetical protein
VFIPSIAEILSGCIRKDTAVGLMGCNVRAPVGQRLGASSIQPVEHATQHLFGDRDLERLPKEAEVRAVDGQPR